MLPLIALTSTVLLAGENGTALKKVEQAPFASKFSAKSLTLDDAVQTALRQNPQVLNAEQEIERTRGQVIQVRAQALPQIGVTANYQQQDRSLLQSSFGGPQSTAQNTPVGVATQAVRPAAATTGTSGVSKTALQNFIQNKTWVVTIEARQVLYSGGQVLAGIRIAKLTEDQTIFKLRDTVDTVISTVRQQFYQVLLNKALITVQEEQVTLLKSQLSDQQNRFEAGTVPRFNVLQAEVALANAIPTLIQARNNYHIAQLQLAKTLGYETRDLPAHAEPFSVVGELAQPPVYTDLSHGLQFARERRPSLKAQRQNILIEVQEIIVQKAGYKPTLNATAGYTLESSRTSHELNDTVAGYFFGFQGSWAIFDGFLTYGNIKQAKARLEEARVNYEDSVQQVDLEVQQAWANLQQAQETIASQKKNVEQATEAVRLARERLSAGAGTQLDVLNSTVALAQARSTELQARFNYNSALAEFERATAADTKYNESFDDPLAHKPPARYCVPNPITRAAN